MRVPTFSFIMAGFRAGWLIALLLGFQAMPMRAADTPRAFSQPYKPSSDEFTGISKAVEQLFKSRDAAQFAKTLAPTVEDYKSILSTNLPIKGEDPSKNFESMSRHKRQTIELGAKALLEKADALHLDFSKGELHPSVIMGRILTVPPICYDGGMFGSSSDEKTSIPVRGP